MSGLTVYIDTLSQPCRAILLFLKKNQIPHNVKYVSVLAGDHKKPEYIDNVHPFGKVPAIDDNGWFLIESIAILRYLSRKYDVLDHWYPKSAIGQAKVDEFLEWHHISLRSPLSMYFLTKLVRPNLTGKPAKEEHISLWQTLMDSALDEIEEVWLKNNLFLTSDKISIADLIGICEVEQPRIAGYDPTSGRPKLKNWMERVKQEVQPYYDEIFVEMDKMIKRNQSNL